MSVQPDPVVSINPPNSIVRKVIVCYDARTCITGFKLLDSNNTIVLEVGAFIWQTAEILLTAEERIVGFESRLNDAAQANHNSLAIIIARRNFQ